MKAYNIYKVSLLFLLVLAAPRAWGQAVVLSFEQCRELSLQNNVDLRNATLDVLAAKELKQEAFTEYFPKVSINAFSFWAPDPLLEIGVKDVLGNSDMANNINSWVQQNAPMYGINTSYTALKWGYSASISVIQPVFAGGRIVSGNRLANLGITAAELQGSIQNKKTTEEIEQMYWKVVSLEEKLKTIDVAQTFLSKLSEDLSTAISAGLATSSDMLQLRLKENELASTRASLVGGIRLSKMNLLNSIGYAYTPYRTINPDNLPFIDEIALQDSTLANLLAPEAYFRDENEVVASRDEARLLEVSVSAKKMERRMVLGEVLPQVGVGASYGYGRILGGGTFNGVFFATLKIPITDWGKYSHRLRRYDYQVQQAENSRDFLCAQLLLQVRKLWFELTVAWDQLELSRESVEVAMDALQSEQANFRAGLVPLSTVLEAQTSLRKMQDAQVDAMIAYRNAVSAYLAL